MQAPLEYRVAIPNTQRAAAASIRPALPGDADVASQIARCAKAHRGYAPEVLGSWHDLLEITPAYIAAHTVFMAECDGVAVGVGALNEHETHRELDHLWVMPSVHGHGVGLALLRRVMEECAGRAGPLRVESDPHAAGFYERAGGAGVGERAAPVPGDLARTLPVFEFHCA